MIKEPPQLNPHNGISKHEVSIKNLGWLSTTQFPSAFSLKSLSSSPCSPQLSPFFLQLCLGDNLFIQWSFWGTWLGAGHKEILFLS